jgi:uncharacterized protein (UPF0332 family)
MKMSLEDWAKLKLIAVEPTSAEEISDLRTVVGTRLQDAKVAGVSPDWRFAAAYNALITSATMAVRAAGYRVPAKGGQHTYALESLAYTIGANDRFIRRLKNFSHKRGTATYEVAGAVSEEEVNSVIATAEELHNTVMQWIQGKHAELLKD